MADEYPNPFAGWDFANAHKCSACWGRLQVVRPVVTEARWVVQCEDCGEATKGFVTSKWVERQSDKSRAELIEAKHALREAVPWLKTTPKTQAAILAELGFR